MDDIFLEEIVFNLIYFDDHHHSSCFLFGLTDSEDFMITQTNEFVVDIVCFKRSNNFNLRRLQNYSLAERDCDAGRCCCCDGRPRVACVVMDSGSEASGFVSCPFESDAVDVMNGLHSF